MTIEVALKKQRMQFLQKLHCIALAICIYTELSQWDTQMQSSRNYSKAHHRRIVKQNAANLLKNIIQGEVSDTFNGSNTNSQNIKSANQTPEKELRISNFATAKEVSCTSEITCDGGPISSFSINVSVSSDSDFSESDCDNFRFELSSWTVANKVPHIHVNKLLKLLKKTNHFKNLPNDARTLVSTPRYTHVREVIPGYYCHFGLKGQVQDYLQNAKSATPISKLLLQFNIDGIPISKSSNKHFVPILGYIVGSNRDPFVVGLWCGEKDKPKNVNEFLREFVDECKDLIS
ncbi:unnamed protein product, partial [Allacma fusca]